MDGFFNGLFRRLRPVTSRTPPRPRHNFPPRRPSAHQSAPREGRLMVEEIVEPVWVLEPDGQD
jgi:hypothetical protein